MFLQYWWSMKVLFNFKLVGQKLDVKILDVC